MNNADKNQIDDAQAVVRQLREKLDEIESRTMTLAGERDAISYAALVDRDAKAKKRLAEINAELLTIAGEGDSVRKEK